MGKKRMLVLGGGVSGLTVAHQLLSSGFDVCLIAKEWHHQTVSVVAGALWEWPPAVCGFHTDIISLEKSKSGVKSLIKNLPSLVGFRIPA